MTHKKLRTTKEKKGKIRKIGMMKTISIKSIYLLLLVGYVAAQDGVFDLVKYGAKQDTEISQVRINQC